MEEYIIKIDKHDKHFVEFRLNMAIMSIKKTRDKCGISENAEHESNREIKVLTSILNQLGLEVYRL